jgi:hypothetical protein
MQPPWDLPVTSWAANDQFKDWIRSSLAVSIGPPAAAAFVIPLVLVISACCVCGPCAQRDNRPSKRHASHGAVIVSLAAVGLLVAGSFVVLGLIHNAVDLAGEVAGVGTDAQTWICQGEVCAAGVPSPPPNAQWIDQCAEGSMGEFLDSMADATSDSSAAVDVFTLKCATPRTMPRARPAHSPSARASPPQPHERDVGGAGACGRRACRRDGEHRDGADCDRRHAYHRAERADERRGDGLGAV